uniref:PARP catalytic domain-containing protein n=1 Tax=Moniliophthora roreri TaxID=221103 RepID=A0A0W0F9V8_MONRR
MSVDSVAAHLPFALSLLHAMAAQYPGLQKPQRSSNLCENCHLNPKYKEGRKTHPYCSKSCAEANAGGNSSNSDCDFCHSRLKHPGHPFCGKACAKKAAAGQTASSKSPPSTCKAPGCQKAVHTKPGGTCGEYCSLSHKTLTEMLCILCLRNPKKANSHFCGRHCSHDAERKGPMILEVPAGHVTFKSVADQFKASWRHPGTTCPQVKRVYKVILTPASSQAYENYKSSVEARGQFVAAGRSKGNENRRWHGTRRECLLGDNGQTQFCTSTTCSLCCILRTSFDVTKAAWGSFGQGIYTSSTSSKSNDFSRNVPKSPMKAILLNKVVVGKGCKMSHANKTLTAPPSGCDSVLAEGGGIVYDELIVFSNDAIRPSFLVMYEV